MTADKRFQLTARPHNGGTYDGKDIGLLSPYLADGHNHVARETATTTGRPPIFRREYYLKLYNDRLDREVERLMAGGAG